MKVVKIKNKIILGKYLNFAKKVAAKITSNHTSEFLYDLKISDKKFKAQALKKNISRLSTKSGDNNTFTGEYSTHLFHRKLE